uniref:Calmodulin n=1 Tax=Phaeomonas parva TaxID=124430 RepID=A0A7S1XT22_9STRA|mmetsp:Transcript_31775/g.100972  ORF Transcript_31775/g.100972 Transcript_31775/m.100972 type:complete len:834 (+) Transcript_31775:231-2732(+)
MGHKGSSLRGAASVHPELLPHTKLTAQEVMAMRLRHQHDLGGSFALTKDKFAVLTNLEEDDASQLFWHIFDTDKNNLVDAFEMQISFCLLSTMGLQEKLDFIFSLYNFSGNGEISMDEMIILLRTVVHAGAKMDKNVEFIETEIAESLTSMAFERVQRDVEEDIRRYEFDRFCLWHPRIAEFLNYWCSSVNQVAIPEGSVFSDRAFPAEASSVYASADAPPAGMMPARHVRWLRPEKVLGPGAKLFNELGFFGVLEQGALGDAWFLSALALVAHKPELIRKLFCHTGQEDSGRYCLQFFKGGNWAPVVLDDKLPCDPADAPLFLSSPAEHSQYWPCLVEKAYAKLHGSYESLIGGRIENALRDLTGGVVRRFPFESVAGEENAPAMIWDRITAGLERGLVGITRGIREGDTTSTAAKKMDLAENLLYVVDRAESVRGKKLLRLKDPFKSDRAYAGDWGWESEMWQEFREVTEDLGMDARGVKGRAEGFFWMDLDDAAALFNTIYDVYVEHEVAKWHAVSRSGAWSTKAGTAAGCCNHRGWRSGEQIYLEVEEGQRLVICLTQQDALFHGVAPDPPAGANAKDAPGSSATSAKDDNPAEEGEEEEESPEEAGAGGAGAAGKEEATSAAAEEATAPAPAAELAPKVRRREETRAIGFVLLKHDFGSAGALRRVEQVTQDNFADGHQEMLPQRDVFTITTLGEGRYALLPMTFDAGLEGQWFVTISGTKQFSVISEKELAMDADEQRQATAPFPEGEEVHQLLTPFSAKAPEAMFPDDLETSKAVAMEKLAMLFDKLGNRAYDLEQKMRALEARIPSLLGGLEEAATARAEAEGLA